MQIVGTVAGRNCVIIDDMIDTAGTLTKAAQLLTDFGAKEVIACATHGVLSEPALERINKSVLSRVYVTDSICQDENLKQCEKLYVLSLAPLLAEAIKRVHNEQSLSVLFNKN